MSQTIWQTGTMLFYFIGVYKYIKIVCTRYEIIATFEVSDSENCALPSPFQSAIDKPRTKEEAPMPEGTENRLVEKVPLPKLRET